MICCRFANRLASELFCAALLAAMLPSCQPTTPPAEPKSFSAFDPQVKALMAEMTLDEKIGQMVQGETASLGDLTDIQKYALGAVLSAGNSDPAEGNTLQAWTDIADRCQEQALKTRLGIPLLYGIDAVHGHSNVLGAVIFPHNIGLGCTHNPELVGEIARITATEVRATGINWTFAPCVAVPRDERWGRMYEGFAEDTMAVSVLGVAAIRELQGDDLAAPLSVLACAKHYVGDGGTSPGTGRDGGIDQGDTQIDEESLRRIHLPPYMAAVEAGVGSVMTSYSSWNGVKCTAQKHLLTEVLKGELGFEGFVVSDYHAIEQLAPDYKDAIEIAINVGVDMAMTPNLHKEFVENLKELVEEGRVPMARIDDAVTRILRVKFAMGLMDKGRSPLADRALHAEFGSAAHRAVAREAVRQSLVLLKNAEDTLPLSKQAARIHVARKSADDLGNQCGGWTIVWQGQSGEVTTGGTTILAAIKKTVSPGTKVTFALDGSGAEGADVGVVVIGETPYAERVGDRTDLALAEEDVAAVRNMKAAGIPVVVVIVSGRTLILGDVVDQADAVVAAWLPGTEGQGVADVLFGDHPPTGKLSFTWPRSRDQIPINVGDKEYDPLFPYGFGLTYEK